MTDYQVCRVYFYDEMPRFNLVIFLKNVFDSMLLNYLQDINTGETFNILYTTPPQKSA